MRGLVYLFMASGVAIAAIFGVREVQNDRWYLLTVGLLLAIGLYGSTFGISVAHARRDAWLILRAVTIGVIAKALLIGTILSLLLGGPTGFLLGIIVAQIDPLSTAALLRGDSMSLRAQSILRAWSSFDDPVTVLASLYVPALIAWMTGSVGAVSGSQSVGGLAAYGWGLAANVLFVLGVFVLWWLMRRKLRGVGYVGIILLGIGIYGLLLGALSMAVYFFWMLGIAVIGLFLRPPIERVLDVALSWATSLAAVLLGILLLGGLSLWKGLALGLTAYLSQFVVGMLLTHSLLRRDRLHIACAQQNGITAIILALLFEPLYPGTVAIVAPAIITINVLHAAVNRALNAHLSGRKHVLRPRYYMRLLGEHFARL